METRYIRAMRGAAKELSEIYEPDYPKVKELRQAIKDVETLSELFLRQRSVQDRKLAKATKRLLKKLGEHFNGIWPESLRDVSEAANQALARIEQSEKRMKPLLDLREVRKLHKWRKP